MLSRRVRFLASEGAGDLALAVVGRVEFRQKYLTALMADVAGGR
jgi:hypothetical protein